MEHTLQLGEILKDGMYPVESEGGDNWRILHGDTLKLVKAFQPGTFDAVITDPPYASGGTKQNERNRTTNQRSGIRQTAGHRREGSASRQSLSYGEVTDLCRSAVRFPVFQVCSDMGIPRTGCM